MSPQSASITSPPLPSPTQLTSPGQTLPPPVAGFVARGMPSKVGLLCAHSSVHKDNLMQINILWNTTI